jgi:uncharacterized Zn finger protein (UPF0148 family)
MPKILEAVECSDCLLELKEGESKVSLDGTILCPACKIEEMKAEETREREEDEIEGGFSEAVEAFQEYKADERLNSLEDN